MSVGRLLQCLSLWVYFFTSRYSTMIKKKVKNEYRLLGIPKDWLAVHGNIVCGFIGLHLRTLQKGQKVTIQPVFYNKKEVSMKKKQKAQKCTGEHLKGILEAKRSFKKYLRESPSRDLLEAWYKLNNANEDEWEELLSIDVLKDFTKKEMDRRGLKETDGELCEEAIDCNGYQEMAEPAVM